jgi:hypothetical protein
MVSKYLFASYGNVSFARIGLKCSHISENFGRNFDFQNCSNIERLMNPKQAVFGQILEKAKFWNSSFEMEWQSDHTFPETAFVLQINWKGSFHN